MNIKRYIIGSLAVFAFIFLFEMIFHGKYLESLYNATAHLWRAKEDCVWPAMLFAQFLFPFIFGYIFIKGYENKGIGEGVRFGGIIGLLFVPTNLIFYAVMPLPTSLVVNWIFGGIVEMIICGVIFASIYKD